MTHEVFRVSNSPYREAAFRRHGMTDAQVHATITNRRIALAAANVTDQTDDALRRWLGDYSDVIRAIAENEVVQRDCADERQGDSA